MPRILYLVHNLSDPAVSRRLAMFQQGGASVELAGFRRSDAPPSNLPVETAIELDITHDGRMLHRLVSALGAAWRSHAWGSSLTQPDVIVARNLEMLGIANRLQRFWPTRPRLVYECLDIHRLMLRQDWTGQGMRRLERRLMRGVDHLITSSPAFLRNHFNEEAPPSLLVENKVFAPHLTAPGSNPALINDFTPLRIGWFGALRCQKSLSALDALSRHLGGRLEIDLRGRPALTAFNDFHAEVRAAPYLNYGGPFDYPDDLAPLYSKAHFVWAIDFFEEGLNSSWLLPNRLYEGCLNGAIPIALAGTETAAFIERLGIGIVVPDISQAHLVPLFQSLTPERVAALAAAVAALDPSIFRCDTQQCRDLVAQLAPAGFTPTLVDEAA